MGLCCVVSFQSIMRIYSAVLFLFINVFSLSPPVRLFFFCPSLALSFIHPLPLIYFCLTTFYFQSLSLLLSCSFGLFVISLGPFSSSFSFAEVPRNDTCPELPEITNGWKTTSHPELVHGTVVTYQCYPGFEVVGTEMLMCQWDLTWSGDLPSCERGERSLALCFLQPLFVNISLFLPPSHLEDYSSLLSLISWYFLLRSGKTGQSIQTMA